MDSSSLSRSEQDEPTQLNTPQTHHLDSNRANAHPVLPRRSPEVRLREHVWLYGDSASRHNKASRRTFDRFADEPTTSAYTAGPAMNKDCLSFG